MQKEDLRINRFRLLKLLSHHQMIAKTSIIEPSPIRVSSATRARTSTSGAVRTARAAPSTLPPTASESGGHARPPGPLPSPRRPIGPCCCLRPHRRILPSGLQPRWRAGARLHVHALRLLVASRFVVLPFTDLVVVLMTSPLPSLGSDSPDLPCYWLTGEGTADQKSSAFPDGCSTRTLSASGLALGESLDLPRRPEDDFGDDVDLPRAKACSY